MASVNVPAPIRELRNPDPKWLDLVLFVVLGSLAAFLAVRALTY